MSNLKHISEFPLLAIWGETVRARRVEGDRLILKRSEDVLRFVHPPGYRYFATLREKLRWSEAPMRKGRNAE